MELSHSYGRLHQVSQASLVEKSASVSIDAQDLQCPELTVFYDGLCPVCAREVASYRRLELKTPIAWLDLAGGVDVLKAEDFTLEQALVLLHVKDAQGNLHVGLAAHVLLWQHLPGLRWLSALLRWSPRLQALCNGAYLFFTRHRPGLKLRERAR
jgi:predicted DCC family thiol-disulfide oxidoreductase YuxK